MRSTESQPETFAWDDPFLLDSSLDESERLIRDSARSFAQDRDGLHEDPALDALAEALPKVGRYPMRLARHAAFPTPLLSHIACEARRKLPPGLFSGPALPLVDFSAAIRVFVREFAPDVLIVLGPGETLGGAVAQSLIAIDWRGLADKNDFSRRQATTPVLLAMGRADQRALVTGGAGRPETRDER